MPITFAVFPRWIAINAPEITRSVGPPLLSEPTVQITHKTFASRAAARRYHRQGD